MAEHRTTDLGMDVVAKYAMATAWSEIRAKGIEAVRAVEVLGRSHVLRDASELRDLRSRARVYQDGLFEAASILAYRAGLEVDWLLERQKDDA